MTRKELVCVLRDYAEMTEEPPTGRAIEGQEEIMRCAADMIEKSVEIDHVLEIIDEKHNDIQNHDWYTDHPTAADRMKLLRELKKEIEYGVRENDNIY